MLHGKSLKCIFLSYSCLQKGYRCFSPDLKRYLVSADVTFFETTSLFPSLERATCPSHTSDCPLLYTSSIPQVECFPDLVDFTANSPPPLLTYHRRHRLVPVENHTTETTTETISEPTPEIYPSLHMRLYRGLT